MIVGCWQIREIMNYDASVRDVDDLKIIGKFNEWSSDIDGLKGILNGVGDIDDFNVMRNFNKWSWELTSER